MRSGFLYDSSLTKLTKNEVRFAWDLDQENAFLETKEKFDTGFAGLTSWYPSHILRDPGIPNAST